MAAKVPALTLQPRFKVPSPVSVTWKLLSRKPLGCTWFLKVIPREAHYLLSCPRGQYARGKRLVAYAHAYAGTACEYEPQRRALERSAL
jgi:hypothetical protein